MDPGSSLSRRTLLQRGFYMMLGAVGVTSAAQSLLPGVASAAPTNSATRLALKGAQFLYVPANEPPGDPPMHGDRGTITGTLLSSGGTKLGYFRGESFFTEGPYVGAPNDESLEFHTFSLADGSISGSGTRGATVGAFAISGGTGRYENAMGSYSASISLPEFGGDGSATFEFHFRNALP